MFLADRYRPHPTAPSPDFNLTVDVDGLVKLLQFGAYVKAKAEAVGGDPQGVVEKELSKYPYAKSKIFKVRTLHLLRHTHFNWKQKNFRVPTSPRWISSR